MQEVILFYKGLDVPTRQILDFKGAMPSLKAADAKKAIQDMVDHYQKRHNGTSTRNRRGRYRAAALGFYQRDSGNPLYQERRQTMEKSLTKFMAGSAKRHDDNSNLIKYEEKEELSGLMNSEKFATYFKRVFMERPRMGYQIEASMNVHDSAILEDSLPPKEKDPESFDTLLY
ncbi:hypothetical protein Tco_0629931 [Tanacetum coccineum]|uniref:Uncharacterized protein n=1 Tax=Tanacetum coccineum TaxID=301880 RepID=A0ABQ4WUK7_9ASTR